MVWLSGSSGDLTWVTHVAAFRRSLGWTWRLQRPCSHVWVLGAECWLGAPQFSLSLSPAGQPGLRYSMWLASENVSTSPPKGYFQSWHSMCSNAFHWPNKSRDQLDSREGNRVHLLMERMAENLWPSWPRNSSMAPYYFWLDIYILPSIFVISYLGFFFLFFSVNVCSLSFVLPMQVSVFLI